MVSIDKQLETIKSGAVEIIQEFELIKKLKDKKTLTVKAGFDPTMPDIHLGHTILLKKLKAFQDLGHKVIFLVGDATALVGDPSGQSQTRKTLTWDEVEKNARTYEKQVSKVLNTHNNKVFERRHNSEWFLSWTFKQFVELSQRYTVARLLERDDFQKRLKENKPITCLELFYPLMQGYDSVVLKSDIELGGTDQKFNMLVGRDLQQSYGQEPQVVITLPILEGMNGTQKMSKSLGNYIGVYESPKDMFGKLMSIPDSLLVKYLRLVSGFSTDYVNKLEKEISSGALNPKNAKEALASDIVSIYHSSKEAETALEEFRQVFSGKLLPKNMPEFEIDKLSLSKSNGKVWIVELLTLTGLVKTNNEARRLISQKGVRLNGNIINSFEDKVGVVDNAVLQIGRRRFVRLKLRL